MYEHEEMTPWTIGPVPARRLERAGRVQWIANVNAPIMVADAVIKLFEDSPHGPCIIIEGKQPRRRNGE